MLKFFFFFGPCLNVAGSWATRCVFVANEGATSFVYILGLLLRIIFSLLIGTMFCC